MGLCLLHSLGWISPSTSNGEKSETADGGDKPDGDTTVDQPVGRAKQSQVDSAG